MSDDATSTTTTPAPAPAAGEATARGGKVTMIGLGLLAVGAILSFISWNGDAHRFGFGYLIGFGFAWAIVLGSLFFVGLQHAVGAVWSVVLRRVGEMFAAPVFWLALLFLPVLLTALLGDHTVFPWQDKADPAGKLAVHNKGTYLNETSFIIRTIAFFAIWLFFSWFFVRGSLKQDDGGSPGTTSRLRKASPIFLILFGFTVTFASFDWYMSLEPNWFSTIYGVYVFGGMTLSALAVITIALHLMKRSGMIAPELIRRDHVYSLGALMFAFTCFWGYIAFSQFMLIWYANMPEETVYFVKRIRNGWGGVTVALAFVRFVIPFFMLLSRQTKMDLGKLAGIGAFLLFGQLFDLYWLVMPNYFGEGGPSLGYQEIGPILLFSGVLLVAAGRFMRRNPVVASGDPAFEASRQFHLH